MKKVRLTKRQLEKMKEQGIVNAIAPGIPRTKTPEPKVEPEPAAPVIVQPAAATVLPVRLQVGRNADGFIEYVDVVPVPQLNKPH